MFNSNATVINGTTFAGALDLVFTPVPEPGTFGLVGLAALFVWRRAIRRRRWKAGAS